MSTVALVGLVTVTEPMTMPSPKLAVVTPWAKLVNCPSTVTVSCSP